MARPVEWTDERRAEVVKVICLAIARGESLRRACSPEGRPSTTSFLEWMQEDSVLAEQYARAREDQADHYADEVIEIADSESDPNKARVRIDARKWAAGKRKPKVYGDRLQLDGDMNVSMTDAQLDTRLTKLLGKAGVAVASGGEGSEEGAA
jgi:hypothetical protein